MESDTSETCPLSVPPFLPVCPLLSVQTCFIPFIHSFTILFHATITFSTSFFSIQNHIKVCSGQEGGVSLEGEVCMDMNRVEWMDMVRGVKGKRGYDS